MIVLLVAGCGSPEPSGESADLADAGTVREITISDRAWAGSSVNVQANTRQTLFTRGNWQYAGFYDANGFLTLGKRRVEEDDWALETTRFSGHVNDAHNHVSLLVDAAGILHVAWDHHNSPLNYATGTAPGVLEIERAAMVGTNEQSVTYPQFYELPDGDLLFLYRDGGSGRGDLVMNRHDHEEGAWRRIHDQLIDGEGERNAYWDLHVDQQGTLHLAWVWRETPDVASNHDLSYARSFDGGETWQQIGGEALEIPIRHTGREVVLQIPQNHDLMNPPVVSADAEGNPFIASYWSDGPGQAPAHHVAACLDGQWQTFRAPTFHPPFRLAGHGTRNPPISRAALMVESTGKDGAMHLVYRDSTQNAILAASMDDLSRPRWIVQRLGGMSGGWEPSIDPQQWRLHRQAHMLLQRVEQLDGDDARGADAAAGPIRLMIWAPASAADYADSHSLPRIPPSLAH